GAPGSQLTGHLGNVITDDATEEDEVVEETLDWHRRRLPMEVTGPHGDEVQVWFRGKVDFPVRVPQFRHANVALLGGRLAKVGDNKAALLTLEVDQRKLSVLAFPMKQANTSRLHVAPTRRQPVIMR